jgi:glycosyltransferase involved in cell wall biosynthesis
VLPVSQVLADFIEAAGVPRRKISVIRNAINPDEFAGAAISTAKKDLGLGAATVLGFVGFVRQWHGLDRAIDLLADAECPPDLHFLVVGDGPALPALKAHAERLRVAARVSYVGLAERARVPYYLGAIDIALQPEAVGYASPLKAFEYMGCSKAIVAPDQANIREILEHGNSAWLFDPAVKASFREAVFALARDPGLRQRLGEGACRVIPERGLTWDDNAARISMLYPALTCGRGGKVHAEPASDRLTSGRAADAKADNGARRDSACSARSHDWIVGRQALSETESGTHHDTTGIR